MREHQELEIRLFNLSKCNSRLFDSASSLSPSRFNSPQSIRSKYSNISPTPSWLSDRLSYTSAANSVDIRPMTHRVATFNSNSTSPKIKFKTRAISIKPRCKQLRLKWDTNDSYVSSPSSSDDSIPDESLNSPSSSESSDEAEIKKKVQYKRRHREIAHTPYEFPVNYIAPNYIGNGMYYPVYPPMNAYLGPYSYYSAYPQNQPHKSQKVDASIQCDNLHLIVPTMKEDSDYSRTPITTAKSSRRASEVKLKQAEESEVLNQALVTTERGSKESNVEDIPCIVDKDNISTDWFRISDSKGINEQNSIPTQISKPQPWVMEFKVNTNKLNFNERHLKMLERLNKITNTRQSRKEKTKDELIEIRKEMLKPKQDKDGKMIEIPVSQQSNHVPTKLMARLCSGDRVKVSKKEMIRLTRKNYLNLPEIKKKIEDERKRKELRERVESAKAYRAKLKEDAKLKRLNRSVDRVK
jgi:hypothetical protein